MTHAVLKQDHLHPAQQEVLCVTQAAQTHDAHRQVNQLVHHQLLQLKDHSAILVAMTHVVRKLLVQPHPHLLKSDAILDLQILVVHSQLSPLNLQLPSSNAILE